MYKRQAFAFIDVLMDASEKYAKVINPAIYFELALLKMCNQVQSKNGELIDKVDIPQTESIQYAVSYTHLLSSAMISYARDFMIDKGFTYCIPPFMIRSDVVTGVMSFEEMDAMMYKIEGEDLYLIGTSEPVSYTHLDVYKRQDYDTLNQRIRELAFLNKGLKLILERCV